MKGWVSLVGWPVADGLPTLVVTHHLQVERRTGKVHIYMTDIVWCISGNGWQPKSTWQFSTCGTDFTPSMACASLEQWNLWCSGVFFTSYGWYCLHTHTPPFNGPFSGTTQESRYQKGKTNLDFTEARDSEWQWHQLGHMQVCTKLQTDNHASTPPLSFLQAGCPSCHPTNSVKALKVQCKIICVKFCCHTGVSS